MDVQSSFEQNSVNTFYHEHGQAKATEIPGYTLGVLIHGAYVDRDFQGKGFGQKYHEERLDWLKKAGYQVAVCLVYDGNKTEKRIMEKFGWDKVSDGWMSVYSKNLLKE